MGEGEGVPHPPPPPPPPQRDISNGLPLIILNVQPEIQ